MSPIRDEDDVGHCMACGKEWPMYKLDAKPGPGDMTPERWEASEGADFNWLEGPCCYGAGYVEGET